MKSKKWVCLFALIVFLGIGGYMALNYYANPFGYFTMQKGYDFFPQEGYTRSVKAQYILEHKDEIEAVILGGSKSGAIDPARLTEYTGLQYYNCCFNIGRFPDYLDFVQFLAKYTNVKEITLHLSSFETLYYSKWLTIKKLQSPAVLTQNRWEMLTEFLSYLMVDVDTLRTALKERTTHWVEGCDVLANGRKTWDTQLKQYWADPEGYINRRVANKRKQRISSMFTQNSTRYKQAEAREVNVECMREIVDICKKNGITLKVIIGASFIGERYTYECAEYYAYLAELVYLCDQIWDFSDTNDYNKNPYNFLNSRHYTMAVGDLMVDTMYGKDKRDGFGILLTRENVLAYLEGRKDRFDELQAEYTETGDIAYFDMDDESYIDLAAYGYGPDYCSYPG
ncbi:MAG: hypothetical protein IJI24_02165 [Lachnospiraceae bacterium]|nr:hypothetical protein [Lachnospiraceae bacterium]